MNIIIVGLFILYLYSRKRQIDTSVWYVPNPDSLYIYPAGTMPFESDVMRYKYQMMKEGQANRIEAAVIAGIVAKESKGVANAVNGRYLGLMQFGLAEARAMGYNGTSNELLDPDNNIRWGTKYLRYCIDKKRGDVARGISGYHTGQVEMANTPYDVAYVSDVASYVPRLRYLMAQAFPGYATVFPKNTWFASQVYV